MTLASRGRRFLGSDAAAGDGLSLLLAGGGLVVCWLDCGRDGVGMALTDSCGTGAVIIGEGGEMG